MKPWFLYVLRSESDGRFYTGVSTDPGRRLRQHNGEIGGGASSTQMHRPWKLAFSVRCKNRSEAQREEYVLKTLSHSTKEALFG